VSGVNGVSGEVARNAAVRRHAIVPLKRWRKTAAKLAIQEQAEKLKDALLMRFNATTQHIVHGDSGRTGVNVPRRVEMEASVVVRGSS